jgi:cardiolipin synthase
MPKAAEAAASVRAPVAFQIDHAFARTAGAQLIEGNAVRLLRDAAENYPAWLAAIEAAQQYVHFETYIFTDDPVGRQFTDAFLRKAKEGVQVRLLYDWLGVLGKTPRKLFRELRAAGVEIRCFNPPHFDQPLGWLRRDHRKTVVCDLEVAFVTGLCVGTPWTGDPAKGKEPWRDTGVELRGPAVREVALAFANSWACAGEPLPAEALPPRNLPPEAQPEPAGDVPVRVVASVPGTAELYRLDLLIAAGATRNLWLADAYYAGTSAYTEALAAAARDGVDVRLLVPGRGSDIAVMQAVSRSGYRQLLQAGVRIFEWNGLMMHAKTAVADGRWSRIGSTNLNVASWIGNWELDVVIEHPGFGKQMEEQYLRDLENATEIVLDERVKLRPVSGRHTRRLRGPDGSAGRVAAGALRLGRRLRAAMIRRPHGPTEAKLMLQAGLLLAALAPLIFLYPLVLAVPLGLFSLWLGLTLLIGAWRSYRER